MTIAETKMRIAKEFIAEYYEWLKDLNEMPDSEFFKKYWSRPVEKMKDNQKSLIYFQKNFGEKRLETYEHKGYTVEELNELARDGFLTHEYYWGRKARSMGYDGVWYKIPQRVAKQIYKEFKA